MGSRWTAGIVGPLAGYADGLESWLTGRGYAASTVWLNERRLAELSDWCLAEGVAPGGVTEATLERFVAQRRVYGQPLTVAGLRLLVGFLRGVGAFPPVPLVEPSPAQRVLVAYRCYLHTERRLAPGTVVSRAEVVGRFLAHLTAGGELNLEKLSVAEVHAFLFENAGRVKVATTRTVAEALRCFLRFLFATGVTARDLSGTVPGVAGYRQSSLPRAVDAATATALLGSCDRRTTTGLRDFAILTLMLRLGLRANEVATMTLADIDWRCGEILLHGKAGRRDRLPLPVDVGQALVGYLQKRPVSSSRVVFLRGQPPAGPLSRNGVVMVPRTASARVGIPVVGAHRLRHTAATDMLRAGASLRDVGQVLRHYAEQTTSLYASVDLASLAQVVRPWPGVEQ